MSGPVSPPLTVREADGSPSGRPINTIVVSNGDLSISGTTATIDTSGTGTIGGTIADTQVAFGSAADTIKGNNKFRFLESAGQLILTGTGDDNAEFLIERSPGSSQTIGIENDSSASPTIRVSVPPNNAKNMLFDNQISDTAVTGGTQGFAFQMGNTADTSISMLTITTTDSASYDVVFNQDSLNDYDVRIEGATDPNLFVADGSQNAIGIGTFPSAGVKLHIKDDESDNDNVVVRIQDSSVDTVGDQVAIEGYWNSAAAGVIYFELRDTGTAASAIVMEAANDAGSLTEFVRMDGNAKAITFNEQSEDVDFRVETNGDDSTLRIVGSTDNVGIGTIPESTAKLHVKDDGTMSFDLLLENTDEDANHGPTLALWRNSASPANGDDCGGINWYFENDAGSRHLLGRLRSEVNSVVAGSETSRLYFSVFQSGTEVQTVSMKHSEVVINDGSHDINFRVESNSNANMLMVDAGLDLVGVGAAPVSGGATFQVPDNTISHYANVNTIRSDAVSTMVMVNEDNQGQMWVHDSASAHTIQLVEGGVKGMHFQFMSTDGGITIDPQGSDTLNGGTASLSRNTNFEIYDVFCYANGKWALSNPA